ncbi:hypothetical protein K2173_017439 [Erythroxylum novogranatense]|uniref:Uncharacterized protein n=1 Tax=Erythroxylum novogranatense TaxID=1862640 RepID=A0AAV8TKK5_9ROSI|nr:hypothetical protein K2173_017439 [Erythroxylum novogranatense]
MWASQHHDGGRTIFLKKDILESYHMTYDTKMNQTNKITKRGSIDECKVVTDPRNRKAGETDVFVHNVDRDVEDKFSMAFLYEGYLVEQEGKLRHFIVPSHKTRLGKPFCP